MKLIKLIIPLFFGIFISFGAYALTEVDCQKRIITSMENAKGLGGSVNDEARWGSIAANDCMKQMQGRSSSMDSGSISIFGLIFILLAVAIIGFVIWAFAFPFIDERKKSLKSNNQKPVTKSSEEINHEILLREKFDLLQGQLQDLTVKEIAKKIKCKEFLVANMLIDSKLESKDYDGKRRNFKSLLKMLDEK